MLRLVLLSIVCACGANHGTSSVSQSPAAAPKLPDAAPFVTPGERMSYRIALGDMELATYDLAVGDITELAGRRAVVVQSHAQASGLVTAIANIDDTFTSWIDVGTGRPLRWFADECASEGDSKERTEARMFEREGNILPMQFHVDDQPPTSEPQTLSHPDVWDYNAFLVALRGWEAPAGSKLTAEVLRSRYLWNVQMTLHGRTKLVTPLGEFPALRFDGHTYKLDRNGKRFPNSKERNFVVWISDDDDRVPLQTVAGTDFGAIKMTIVDYVPGNGSRLR